MSLMMKFLLAVPYKISSRCRCSLVGNAYKRPSNSKENEDLDSSQVEKKGGQFYGKETAGGRQAVCKKEEEKQVAEAAPHQKKVKEKLGAYSSSNSIKCLSICLILITMMWKISACASYKLSQASTLDEYLAEFEKLYTQTPGRPLC
ncbi:hypothetical protein L6452_16681 [Arctium lappa]|uniref:Uncharacterized protein n=1 Tax=Arctium lappa TaxID=4217 RepID=A0ACB9C1D1_ARCLA|nr:hypothetical protein L6452_16681 [Arctium lappa]